MGVPRLLREYFGIMEFFIIHVFKSIVYKNSYGKQLHEKLIKLETVRKWFKCVNYLIKEVKLKMD